MTTPARKEFAIVKTFTTVAILFIATANVTAQTNPGPFNLQPRESNPVKPPLYFPAIPAPVLYDLDQDGDKDLIAGASYQGYGDGVRYYENIGTSAAPMFTERESWENPFYYLVYDYSNPHSYISPAIGDFDNDGDPDLFCGFLAGQIRYYRNDGNLDFQLQNGAWDPALRTGNPFHGLNVGFYTYPHATDFDNDGDIDVLVSTLLHDTYGTTVHLYVNDGAGNLTREDIVGINPQGGKITVTTTDLDGDGATDIITGEEEGLFRFFRNTGNGYAETPSVLGDLDAGAFTAAFFADLNGDGSTDLVTGSSPAGGQTVKLFLRSGDGFSLQQGFTSPFGGFDAGNDAVPTFSDYDNDGDLDLLVSNSNNRIGLLRNDAGAFAPVPDDENPFAQIVPGDDFTISYVDLNGDGFRDVIGAAEGRIQLFYHTPEGFHEAVHSEGPFAHILAVDNAKSDLVDIDGDGDFDLFLSDEYADDETTPEYESGYHLRYFENTGTPDSPVFTERVGAENLMAGILEEYELYPRFADVDHDGDLDATIGEGGEVHVEVPESNEFLYLENTGSATAPSFTYRGNLIPQYDNAEYFAPAFLDYDNDGDLDVFEGSGGGQIYLYRNDNTPPQTVISDQPLIVLAGDGMAIIDENLTITDVDGDEISGIIVTIGNYEPTDSLTFSNPGGNNITFDFDEATGTLTIRGNGSPAFYQTLLRTLRLSFEVAADEAGRTAAAISTRNISLLILDTDRTQNAPVSREVQISTSVNTPPVMVNHAVTAMANHTVIIDLNTLISDADGAADIDLSSLSVVTSPASSAPTTIDAGGILSIDYTGTAFAGTETLALRVCDLAGACAQNTLTLTLTNTPPVFAAASATISYGAIATFDLGELISDNESNEDMTTLNVIDGPASGVVAVIGEDMRLVVDYAEAAFAGTDALTLAVCDRIGACSQAVMTIDVTNTAPVVSPGVMNASPGSVVTVDLLDITEDAEDNLNPDAFSVVAPPVSGAVASIDGTVLSIDYSGTTFEGTDQLRIRSCDEAGACGEQTVTVVIESESDIVVYNAVAPRGAADNKWMRISNLPAQNRVTIFNRWGDVVFETENYDDEVSNKRFDGRTPNGRELPSGTYFYKIEFTGGQRPSMTGYLSLVQ